MTSVFTKIINRELPSQIIWEDDDVIVFLPKEHFVNPGHLLVVPKIEIDYIFDLEIQLFHKLWNVVHLIEKPLKEITKAKRIGIAVEGFSVPHVHIHLCPINEQGQLDPKRKTKWAKEEQELFVKKMKSKLSSATF